MLLRAGRGQRADSAGQHVVVSRQLHRQFHYRLLRPQGARVARGRRRAAERTCRTQHPLLFEIEDFNSALFGGEYLFGIGRHIEAGVGVGYSQRTVPTRLCATSRIADDTEIEQELKLRQVPVTFTGRFLLLPRGSAVEPYVGAGLVAIRYRYSEIGEFVAGPRRHLPGALRRGGVAVGPTVLAGLRAPFENWTVGGEVRWQKAEGKDLFDRGIPRRPLDLGGWTANFTFGVRF